MSLKKLGRQMEEERAAIKEMLEAFSKIYLKDYLYKVSQKGSGAVYLSMIVYFPKHTPEPEVLCDANVVLNPQKGSRTIIEGHFNGKEFTFPDVTSLEKMLKEKIASFLKSNSDLLIKRT